MCRETNDSVSVGIEFRVFVDCKRIGNIREHYLYSWHTIAKLSENVYMLSSSADDSAMVKLVICANTMMNNPYC